MLKSSVWHIEGLLGNILYHMSYNTSCIYFLEILAFLHIYVLLHSHIMVYRISHIVGFRFCTLYLRKYHVMFHILYYYDLPDLPKADIKFRAGMPLSVLFQHRSRSAVA